MSGFQRKIERRIRAKEQDIRDLMTERELLEGRLREIDAKIRAEQAAVEAFRESLEVASRPGGAQSGRRKLRPGTLVADARNALQRLGRPTHITELLTEMGREANRGNRTSLAGSLSAYVRDGEIFTRERPNTFGLIEFGESEPEEENETAPSHSRKQRNGAVEIQA